MDYFLKESARYLLRELGNDFTGIAVIFPGKRSRLYFNKYLSELSESPIWSPAYYTITELMEELSGYRVAEKLTLIFELYTIYQKVTGSTENIDTFFFYAEMLLSDFDEVDKYLVNSRDLFRNMAELKNIENYFDYLQEEQIAVIRRFWDSFRSGPDSPDKKSFLALWEFMHDIYTLFREALQHKGMAYEGMVYRHVAEMIRAGNLSEKGYSKYLFIGFNALNKSEDLLFSYLKKTGKGVFLWDYDEYYINNNIHEAGYFIRENIKKYPPPAINTEFKNITGKDRNIHIVSIPSSAGQSCIIPVWFRKLADSGNREKDSTAIVLADEKLLLPVLAAIPENVEEINVTMGYPFSHSTVYNLILSIADFHRNNKVINGSRRYYYKDTVALLESIQLTGSVNSEITDLNKFILKANKTWLTSEEIAVNPLLELICDLPGEVRKIPDYLTEILAEFTRQTNNNSANRNLKNFNAEFQYLAIVTCKRLKALLQHTDVNMPSDTLFSLLLKSLSVLTVPFSGEPLKGIQVMGILETRGLDFENIILLSMNEGIFPRTGNLPTFIPLSLRHGFDMPVPEHRDAIYAYYFYRLIQRAKTAVLVYNSRHDGLTTGERSRFLHQVYYEPVFRVNETSMFAEVGVSSQKRITISKSGEVLTRLQKYIQPDTADILSPSAINTFLNCSLQFYFRYIAGLKEPDMVSEVLDPRLFGSVLHKAMELIYRPFKGHSITPAEIDRLIADKEGVSDIIFKALKTEYFGNAEVELTGRNIILREVLQKYLYKILNIDKIYAPFKILALEEHCQIRLSLSDGRNIKIGGIIDRVDEKDGRVRIIDYKTGKKNNIFPDMGSLFELPGSKRNGAAFQTFVYALIYSQTEKSKWIMPGLYFVRDVFSKKFDYRIFMKESRTQGIPVENANDFLQQFEEMLKKTFEKMIEPDIPFIQTDDLESCNFCPYASICQRDKV